ncbi:MAG TPA: ATP-grasp domain-containing protein [Verrucomicrobiae bacterium]|nr:ATP-grasp domain-containing protein [Verrucomicrobiae bacterium]
MLGIDVSEKPRRFNYLLHLEDSSQIADCRLFIPIEAIRLAADKRQLALAFHQNGVPTPLTRLFDDFDQAKNFVRQHSETEWCLKYPAGCGGAGHQLISEGTAEPANWPRPFVVQEFIRLERPVVYRVYCAGGELFAWIMRRFPASIAPSPWVAHARGARYVRLPKPPSEATEVAHRALMATGLWSSFGCVDLLLKPTGAWVVLEVGTDGLFNHVDRELGDRDLESELQRRVANAFWSAAAQ